MLGEKVPAPRLDGTGSCQQGGLKCVALGANLRTLKCEPRTGL